ncbi:MAG: hypothetical protein K0U59_04100 [Gammaproteobacteria bacterium]|nr:hypothetical protein [Gammaproteobacteria bacterium]
MRTQKQKWGNLLSVKGSRRVLTVSFGFWSSAALPFSETQAAVSEVKIWLLVFAILIPISLLHFTFLALPALSQSTLNCKLFAQFEDLSRLR